MKYYLLIQVEQLKILTDDGKIFHPYTCMIKFGEDLKLIVISEMLGFPKFCIKE